MKTIVLHALRGGVDRHRLVSQTASRPTLLLLSPIRVNSCPFVVSYCMVMAKQVENLRHGRLKICATFSAPDATRKNLRCVKMTQGASRFEKAKIRACQ